MYYSQQSPAGRRLWIYIYTNSVNIKVSRHDSYKKKERIAQDIRLSAPVAADAAFKKPFCSFGSSDARLFFELLAN